jgi:hypothetical protein
MRDPSLLMKVVKGGMEKKKKNNHKDAIVGV